ncbi:MULTISPECIES: hypothetical protein [unclassified Sphingomonas]|uniref:hypothetical protein n=1 Tax=unclassified Sphingomonas TaxID=196159 RepID=UPI0006FAE53A|nr:MULTISPECIES: hypothetical protein [unclassified Sphingomonas]KQS46270.1 hypothetical protein ASG20_18165 [Sphingomonas sp. Leaf198]TCP65988.1 hypothetical protein C8J43_10743 [Sphingomonas sp. PP-CE-1G-424]
MTDGGLHAGVDRQRCIGFDRILDTDRRIRGTLAASPAVLASRERGDPIAIGWQPAIAVSAHPRPIWSQIGEYLYFNAPAVAEYRCTRALIDVTPFAGAPDAAVEALLVATALPATLWMRGDVMLHAAAIVPHDCDDDGALAIAGASGSGKSRLAAEFLARGASLVADDSIAVRRQHGQVRCAGLAGGYHLERHLKSNPATRDTTERAFHAVAEHRARGSARLAAIVVLEDDLQTDRTRLHGVAAVEALLANRHRASVPRRCGLEPRGLRDVAHFARTVPVWKWPRHDADALLDDDVRHMIMQEKGQQ